MPDSKKNCKLVAGNAMGTYEIALIMKITFDINSAGQCVAADEQIPVIAAPATYDDLELPAVSPPCWDSDLYAFKPGTDVVVQGQAYSYSSPSKLVETQLQLEDAKRSIRVHGERHLEWHQGQPRFTEAAAFEAMPIRYDRAYGGFDATLDTAPGELATQIMAQRSPDERWDAATRQYYPRNPSGCGYLTQLTPASSEGLKIPNLEFPFDIITPQRLAIGSANDWMQAPLPACFDWTDASWFPRIAYLGLTPEYTLPEEGVREVNHGWATPNLLQHKSVLQLQMHPTFQHGASPCLIRKQLQPSARFRLVNLFPDHPERQIQLTSKSPRVQIQLTANQTLETDSRLGTVVIKPDENKLIEVWSARATVTRPYGLNELENMTWNVQWN